MLLACLIVLGITGMVAEGQAIELCSAQSKVLMRSVNISNKTIGALCRKATLSTSILAISLQRSEDQFGYCRVTLALHNNSAEYLNTLSLTSLEGLFETFQFDNILPGRVGYAAASSRVLMECAELPEIRIRLHWPPTLRIADKAPTGRLLQHYKPVLLDSFLHWN